MARSLFRHSHAGKEARLCGGSHLIAGHRHWREQRHLQRHQRALAAPIALSGCGSFSHPLEPLARIERGAGLVLARSIPRREDAEPGL